MDPLLPPRRRSPYWVRALADQALHGLAGKLQRLEHEPQASFTSHQDWLLDACISELEYRAREDRRRGIGACTCCFCFGPFEDERDPWGQH